MVSTTAETAVGRGSVAFQTPANINVEAIAVTAIKERSMTPLYESIGSRRFTSGYYFSSGTVGDKMSAMERGTNVQRLADPAFSHRRYIPVGLPSLPL